jgi:hypothetical protein
LRVGGALVTEQKNERQDVSEEHEQWAVTGFTLDLDLCHYLYAIRSGELTLTITRPHLPEISIQFFVAPGVAASCLAKAASA